MKRIKIVNKLMLSLLILICNGNCSFVSATAWSMVDLGAVGSGVMQGVKIGNVRGDGINRVYGANRGGSIYEFTYSGGNWNYTEIITSLGLLGRLDIGNGKNDGVKRIYTASESNPVYQISYSGGSWLQEAVSVNSMSDINVGVGRNDGINRIYATNFADYHIYEFSWNGSAWVKVDMGSGGNSMVCIEVGDGRGDGVQRVYAGGADNHIYEFSWNGSAWIKLDLGAATSAMEDISIGRGRNDGLNRVYGVSADWIIYEFTYTGGTWNKTTISPNAGGGGRSIIIGNGRNDGGNNIYSGKAYSVYEFNYSQSTWNNIELGATGSWEWQLALGNGRNDGVNRIYATSYDDAFTKGHIYEFTSLPSTITRSPTTMSFTGQQNGSNPADQTLSISNTGGGTLSWSVSDDATWLSLSPTSGSSTGETDSVTVSVNTSGLSAGTHNGTITITGTGATNTPQTVTVTLTVTSAAPTITRSPTTMSFTGQQGGSNPANQALSISNTGGGTLNWSVSDNAAWLTLSPTSGDSTGETDSVTVSINTSGLSAGTYNGTITITGTGATNTPQTVAVTLTVTSVAPTITRSPTTMSFTGQQGGSNPANQALSISNTGGGTLNWSVSDDAAWLSLSPTSGSSTGETDSVTVSINTSGLSAGTYNGTITITGTGATNTPQTVTIALTIATSGSSTIVGGVKGFVNPMKGEKLTIGFKATGAGTVKTKIFDGTGRLVRELSTPTDGTQRGSLQWDARDANGNLVSSGIYIIRIEGPGINTTKRTVILK